MLSSIVFVLFLCCLSPLVAILIVENPIPSIASAPQEISWDQLPVRVEGQTGNTNGARDYYSIINLVPGQDLIVSLTDGCSTVSCPYETLSLIFTVNGTSTSYSADSCYERTISSPSSLTVSITSLTSYQVRYGLVFRVAGTPPYQPTCTSTELDYDFTNPPLPSTSIPLDPYNRSYCVEDSGTDSLYTHTMGPYTSPFSASGALSGSYDQSDRYKVYIPFTATWNISVGTANGNCAPYPLVCQGDPKIYIYDEDYDYVTSMDDTLGLCPEIRMQIIGPSYVYITVSLATPSANRIPYTLFMYTAAQNFSVDCFSLNSSNCRAYEFPSNLLGGSSNPSSPRSPSSGSVTALDFIWLYIMGACLGVIIIIPAIILCLTSNKGEKAAENCLYILMCPCLVINRCCKAIIRSVPSVHQRTKSHKQKPTTDPETPTPVSDFPPSTGPVVPVIVSETKSTSSEEPSNVSLSTDRTTRSAVSLETEPEVDPAALYRKALSQQTL